MLTQVNTYKAVGERVCDVWLAGGDLDELLHVGRPYVERWAKAAGCTQNHIIGRPGWARVLKPFGYEPYALITRKIID
jgi:hypothetical protein